MRHFIVDYAMATLMFSLAFLIATVSVLHVVEYIQTPK